MVSKGFVNKGREEVEWLVAEREEGRGREGKIAEGGGLIKGERWGKEGGLAEGLVFEGAKVGLLREAKDVDLT